MTEEFQAALAAAIADFEAHGREDAMSPGEMIVVGINRADSIKVADMAIQEFGPDLCSDNEDTRRGAMLGITEMCMSIGVRLERARWERS